MDRSPRPMHEGTVHDEGNASLSETRSRRTVTQDALQIDPGSNPGVTATGTWSRDRAAEAARQLPVEFLEDIRASLTHGRALPESTQIALQDQSSERFSDRSFLMGKLPDGQRLLLEFGPVDATSALDGPIARIESPDGSVTWADATDDEVLHRYLREIATERGPRALGSIPRLGIGTRMTTACWPAIFRAMKSRGFAANAIQNSVRELNFLDDLTAGRPAERNYAPGFGTIESGYTGSSFEGLWTWGVLDAMQHAGTCSFGSDADHLQIKRGPMGMVQAKRYVDSFRYYTFFTIDMVDILDFTAMTIDSDSAARERSEAAVGESALHRDVVGYHRGRRSVVGVDTPPTALIHRLIAKYWRAFESLEELDAYIRQTKDGEPYDLEFTIDEHPPEIAAFDCLTTEQECLFIMDEADRRGLPLTHIAPNVGTEKGFDYRGEDGIAGFERRLRALTDVIASRGLIIDVHSADDLSEASRTAIRRATRGRLHYKISPMVQLLFAEVLEETDPGLFSEWWHDAVAYAREESSGGSAFAADCLARLDAKGHQRPSAQDAVFHHYSFRFPGRRGVDGQFLNRERFYLLAPEFYRLHEERLANLIISLAEDLFA